MWLVTLLRQLPVFGLVSRYLTNNLIGRGPLLRRQQSEDLATFPRHHLDAGNTEYYLQFLEAMFLLKVGYPRVTHRFAANLKISAPIDPKVSGYFNKKVRSTCMPYPRRQRSL